jgi:glucuronokinase
MFEESWPAFEIKKAQAIMTIQTRAFARAGILGNPSDGYFGKIIAVSIQDFEARVFCEESHELMIQSHRDDIPVYKNIHDFAKRVELYGYYGGVRLVKAAIKKFRDHCQKHGIPLENKNFVIRYSSGIPRQLGLGGSSAIITAAFRALMEFYSVAIPVEIQPTLILEAERDELGINAGFMDRVVQVYEGCVYMDLDEKIVRERGHGIYERLSPKFLPKLYLAYKPALGKVSGRVLNDIRQEYDRGNPSVYETLRHIAEKAEMGKEALLKRDFKTLHRLMDENFDLRSRIMKISAGNMEMIRTARACGASAKFAGSGGSIIGMYADEEMYARLESELSGIGAKVIKPRIE